MAQQLTPSFNGKVLILTPGFPDGESDSTCIPYLQDYVLGLADRIGAERVRIISFQYPFRKGAYEWHGINVWSAGGRNKRGFFKWLTWQRVMKQARYWMDEETVIHSYWLTEATEVGARLAAKYGCPHIATIMGQDVLLTNPYLQRISFERVSVVAPNSRAAGYYSMHTGLDPDALIPHTIAPLQAGNKERDIHLLFAGSLTEGKQPLLFLDTVKTLCERMPEIQVVMAGKGPLTDACERAIEKDSLPVQLMGELPRKEVHQLMQRTQVLLHTSRYEGHSTVISEALSCGCQVVCFDVGRTESEAITLADDAAQLPEKVFEALQTEGGHNGLFREKFEESLSQYIELYSVRG
jgi:glycosyltransferase involved in cell wall biosynthesis